MSSSARQRVSPHFSESRAEIDRAFAAAGLAMELSAT
jgi:hypothetical protein